MLPLIPLIAKAAPAIMSVGGKALKLAKGVGGKIAGVFGKAKEFFQRNKPGMKAAIDSAKSLGSQGAFGPLVQQGIGLANDVQSMIPQLANDARAMATNATAKLAEETSSNDPEWFEEFKSAGATMNELIATDQTGNYGWAPDGMLSQTDRQVIQTNVSNVVQGISFPFGKTSGKAKSNLLPAILADVRKAANNVLADNVSQYWETFRDFMYLYEVYYSGKKLLEYSEHLPINIPAANAVFPAIIPANISQFRGMIESLGHYLKTTVRLPYSIVAYIRWRFGTMFLTDASDNTAMSSYSPQVIEWRYKDITPITAGEGLNQRITPIEQYEGDPYVSFKTGYIVVDGTLEDIYNMSVGYNLETCPIEAWVSSIARAQRRIAGRGRAPADIRLAYESHSIDYTVEPRHFDAKEANVRCNAAYYGPFQTGLPFTEWYKAKPVAHNAVVVMNSALPMSEGIQSMCLSTVFEGLNTDDYTAFPVMGKVEVCPLSVNFRSVSDLAMGQAGQTVSQDGWKVRAIICPNSGTPTGNNTLGMKTFETGGFDPIVSFHQVIQDQDRIEFIIAGAGGCELYTFVKNDITQFAVSQLYGASKMPVGRAFNLLTGRCGTDADDVYVDGVKHDWLGTDTYTLGAGWHKFHVKSNYRDLTQTFQSPKFGYLNHRVKVTAEGDFVIGGGANTIGITEYGFFHSSSQTYCLDVEATAQERVKVYSAIATDASEIATPDQEFGNMMRTNKNSPFAFRFQGIECLIGTHLINDYAKQLEIFHPGAGQMYATYKDAADTEHGTIYLTGLQSYDYATITTEQVSAIHRTAFRNLTRDSLKQKKGVGSLEATKQFAKDALDIVG